MPESKQKSDCFSLTQTNQFPKAFTVKEYSYPADPGEPTLFEQLKEINQIEGRKENPEKNKYVTFTDYFVDSSTAFLLVSFSEETAKFSVSDVIDLTQVDNANMSQVFMAIKDNTIIASIQIGSVSGLPNKINQILDFLKISKKVTENMNNDVVSKIKKEGINSIKINGSFSSESLPLDEEQMFFLNSLAGNAPPVSDSAVIGDLNLSKKSWNIFGEFSANISKNIEELDDSILNNIANEFSDDFFIITNKGTRINSKSIVSQKKYFLKKYGNTVMKTNAYAALADFIHEIP